MTALAKYELLEAPGRYFDGQVAEAVEVIVKFGDASLIIFTLDDMPITHWSLAGLRDVGHGGESLSLTPDRESDERLVLTDKDMVSAIREVCPALYEKDAPPPKKQSSSRRVIFWAGAAILSVYLILFHIAPAFSDRLAGMIPAETEIEIGEQISGPFARLFSEGEPRFCTGGAGEEALKKMVARLSGSADLYLPLNVRVLDSKAVNAFALPGGQIVILRGLLRAAEDPEALAGVLAHEIGHVAARDPMRLTLRAAGTAGLLGLVLGDFTGATITVTLSDALIRSGYQQEAETAADEFAAKLLAAKSLPTLPMAKFFRRMEEKSGEKPGLFAHLASHPEYRQRISAMEAADTIGNQPFEPVLSDQDWVALRNICR